MGITGNRASRCCFKGLSARAIPPGSPDILRIR